MPNARNPQAVAFRNNAPVPAWIFMGVWMATLCCQTYIYVRDFGGELDWMGPLLLLFWVFGFRGCKWALSQPRVSVEIAARSALTRETFLWATRERRFAASDLSVPDVIEGKDGEDDLYFKCLLTLPDHRSLVVAEGGRRESVDAARAKLLAALRAA
jgi:hypothetical protein